MEYQNVKVVGYCDVPAPSQPTHAARLQDVQAAQSQAPIFITNVTSPGGNAGNFQYVPGTVPANKIITHAAVDQTSVRVHFMAESPATFYSPSITVDGTPVTNIQEAGDDRRVYIGYHDIVLPESGPITLTSSSGATATVEIELAIGGPAISSATLGAYPGSQTEVKAGDTLTISGTVANGATSMQVVDFGVASSGSITLGAADSGGAGLKSFTGTVTVANRTGTVAARLTATNALGTVGTAFDTTNTRVLNQTVPTIAVPTFTYPASQEAVKNGQTVTANAAVANATTIQYTFTRGTVDNDTTIATAKTLNCTASNVYEATGTNYTITAVRTANGATTTRTGLVIVASQAATVNISITGNPARLRSSAAGNDYTVNVTSNQNVHTSQPPTLVATDAGAWVGSWTRSGNTWSRTLRIDDTDPAGSYVFSGLSLMNKALVETTAINSGAVYVVGGFVLRTITVPAFQRYVPIGATVVTNSKVRAQYAGTGSDLTLRADTADAQNSFTLVNSSGNYAASGGTHLFISDLAFANSNTSGTLQLTIEEQV